MSTQHRGRQRNADPERRPLLQRAVFSHHPEGEPMYSCVTNNVGAHLPVYTTIHRIRRDVIAIVEDYLSPDQLRDMRINLSVVRPLVDKLYELDDISIVYCLFVNRAQFLQEQHHLTNRQNVHRTRADLCELVATRILRRFHEDSPGPEGLLVLANTLVAGFQPFQNAPAEISAAAGFPTGWAHSQTLPALEVAILCESKIFLSSTSCQKVIDAIYDGRIIYTPSSFLNIIPDRYKQKPISLYDPREAGLLNQYRLIVPRTRNILEVVQFVILLCLYLAFMLERDPTKYTVTEVAFAVYAFGWVLDQFATILEHGWSVYTQNLWSFLDVMFAIIYWAYLILRIHGHMIQSVDPARQALDVLAMGAPVLVPRLAFNLLSDNLLFVCLRAMMVDFTLLTVLAAWCFLGFLLSMVWLAEGSHSLITIAKWMLYIWFGLDGSGIQNSTDFHWILGPSLMVIFAFLGNTLFLTILVSMLSNTFSTIVSNATAEIQFRRAVLTLEGVKSDAIFAYQPPFNILALCVLVPLKFVVTPRWFHKIHVASVRLLNLPLLLVIAAAERRMLWPGTESAAAKYDNDSGGGGGGGLVAPGWRSKLWDRWRTWRITAHGDLQAVFDVAPPDSALDEVQADDAFTHHLIRRQFARHHTAETIPRQASGSHGSGSGGGGGGGGTGGDGAAGGLGKPPAPPSRRDSIAPFPGLAQQLRGILSESDEVTDLSRRMEKLEESSARIESMLAKLVGGGVIGGDEDEFGDGDIVASPAARSATETDFRMEQEDEERSPRS